MGNRTEAISDGRSMSPCSGFPTHWGGRAALPGSLGQRLRVPGQLELGSRSFREEKPVDLWESSRGPDLYLLDTLNCQKSTLVNMRFEEFATRNSQTNSSLLSNVVDQHESILICSALISASALRSAIIRRSRSCAVFLASRFASKSATITAAVVPIAPSASQVTDQSA